MAEPEVTTDYAARARDAVRNAAARIVAGEDDFMGSEWGTALDRALRHARAAEAFEVLDRTRCCQHKSDVTMNGRCELQDRKTVAAAELRAIEEEIDANPQG